jgi:hypothetical protein
MASSMAAMFDPLRDAAANHDADYEFLPLLRDSATASASKQSQATDDGHLCQPTSLNGDHYDDGSCRP